MQSVNPILPRLLLLFCLFPGTLPAQKFTISGIVSEESGGEKIIGANIYDSLTFKGTVTNNFGFYSLSLDKGKVCLVCSFIGYAYHSQRFNLNKDTVINLTLSPVLEIEEVTITADKAKDMVKSTQMGNMSIPMKQVKSLPVILGEVDILKTLQLMPGIKAGNEGTSGIYVRGGGPDQNLFLLDGVPVYNINHLFGFFSVFNADAIQNISVYKGGFPARYGGRLSSVIDIRMKDGNAKEFQGEAAVGLISSKVSLEGPIVKNKSSFIVSFRRTYFDLFLNPVQKLINDNTKSGYYFYDFNGKINYRLSDKSRIFLSVYSGLDKAYSKEKHEWENYERTLKTHYNSKNAIYWGNITAALRWNYMASKKIFTNTTLTYSRYQFDLALHNEQNTKPVAQSEDFIHSSRYFSGINDFSGKVELDFIPSPAHYIRGGFNYIYHIFHPGISVTHLKNIGQSIERDTTIGNRDIFSHEAFVFIEDDLTISKKLKANIGMHYSSVLVKSAFYQSLQPRISARYLLTNNWSVKASYIRMVQYINLLTNTTVGLPTDLWLPVTDKVKPQQSGQYALGTALRLFKDFSLSLEAYYKTMNNIIEYKEGASFFNQSGGWEDKIASGKGWSYGAETLVEKNEGKTRGWIGYTLSWTDRQIDEVNFGKVFPYRYDRRHDISIALTRYISERIAVGITWVYGTGRAITLAKQKYPSLMEYFNSSSWYPQDNIIYYPSENSIIEHYESRNGFREPAYHRLDFSANFHKKVRWGERTFSFGIYNVYNRQNPFYLYYGHKYSISSSSENIYLLQRSFYTIMPSIRYSLKF
ncbi:MAG: TonB-dependent receptor plug domain-containing protein [Bacteroidales bacterium]|nr:TonB-dependent receptor plug domain-containing protein [Bacteroidales bacterium]